MTNTGEDSLHAHTSNHTLNPTYKHIYPVFCPKKIKEAKRKKEEQGKIKYKI